VSAIGAGGGPVFTFNITSNVSLENTAPIDLNAMGLANPATVNPNYSTPSTGDGGGASTENSAGERVSLVIGVVLGLVLLAAGVQFA
jgi:hypothetical protein